MAAIGGIVAWFVLWIFGGQVMFSTFLPANAFLANSIILLTCVLAGEAAVFAIRLAYAPFHFMLEPYGGFRAFLGKKLGSHMPPVFIVIGLVGLLAVGVSIGGLIGRYGIREGPGVRTQTTGRIPWNFDQPGDFYFLGITRLNDQEPRILGFQAHGKNTSADPISEFSGYMRSDLTNAQRPILLMAQEPTADPNRPSFMRAPLIPTLPDQTYGIPGLAEFDIVTFDKPSARTGIDGEPASQFMSDFGPFTIVLNYDGKTIERHFTIEQIKAQLALFKKQTFPQDGSTPRVTRKPTAPPVQSLPLFPAPTEQKK